MKCSNHYPPELIEMTKSVVEPSLGQRLTDEEAEEVIRRWKGFLKLITENLAKASVDSQEVEGQEEGTFMP